MFIYYICVLYIYDVHITYIHSHICIYTQTYVYACVYKCECVHITLYILYTYFVYNTHIYSYRVQNLNKLRLFFFSNSLSGKSATILKNIFLVNRNSCLVWSPFEVSELFVMWSQYFSLQCMPES